MKRVTNEAFTPYSDLYSSVTSVIISVQANHCNNSFERCCLRCLHKKRHRPQSYTIQYMEGYYNMIKMIFDYLLIVEISAKSHLHRNKWEITGTSCCTFTIGPYKMVTAGCPINYRVCNFAGQHPKEYGHKGYLIATK